MSLVSLLPLLLKISIMLSVFAIGLKATFSDATYLFRRPAFLLRALLSMNVLMPLFALLLGVTFDLNPAVKIALVVLSVSPIPPVLPKRALKSGGKENYAIGVLVATAVLAIIVIPVTMELFEAITGRSLAMSAATVAMLVLTSVLAPLLVGITVRALLPTFADRTAKPMALTGMIILVLAILPVLFSLLRPMLTLIGDGTLLALAAFAIVGVIVGHLLGGPEPENRAVLALATSSRHPAVALAIAHANFPDQKLVIAAVVIYLVLSGILSAPYLSWSKRLQSAPATREKHVEA